MCMYIFYKDSTVVDFHMTFETSLVLIDPLNIPASTISTHSLPRYAQHVL